MPKSQFVLWTLLLLSVAPTAVAVQFDDFADRPELSLVGSAAVAERTLRLTPSRKDQSGAAWLRNKQPVAAGFDTSFDFQLTQQGGVGHGADGFAFVLQNSGQDVLGARGSAGGFAVDKWSRRPSQSGIPWSIAVFFDTHRNLWARDPSGNYIALCTHGRPEEMRWPASRMAFTRKMPIKLKDGNVHAARILYRAPTLSVFLDNSSTPILQSRIDLSIVLDETGSAWVGFTASTGAGYENHDILKWSWNSTAVSSNAALVSSSITYSPSSCLPDRKLCTPENAIITPTARGYHVILPGNSPWGARIRNEAGGSLVLKNARGIVCRDVEDSGKDTCSGPFPENTPAGAGFLAPDAPKGALIMKTGGDLTRLSVNGPSNEDFKRYEGFYEFDLERP